MKCYEVLIFSGLLRLHSIVILEYLDQQVKTRDRRSLLLLSKDVFEGCASLCYCYYWYAVFSIPGNYQADCLEHSSLMYLYSYIGTALQAVLGMSTKCDTLNTSVSLEIVSYTTIASCLWCYLVLVAYGVLCYSAREYY